MEYPAYDEDLFPYRLGHCQQESRLRFDQRAMDERNILCLKVRGLCCA
jgi:hypothetical protein